MLDAIEPDTSIAPLMKRGFNFHKAGNNLAAAKIFEVAYRRDPSALAAALNMGSAYYKAKYYPEAEEAYREVLRNDPESASAHYGLAMIYEEIGDRLTAREYFKKAAELKPLSGKMWYSLAEVTYEETARNQALNRAVKAVSEQLKTDRLDHTAAMECGSILSGAGKWSDATNAYKIALLREPSSLNARMGLVKCYRKSNSNGAAADAYRDIIMQCTPPFELRKYNRSFVSAAQKSLIEIHSTLSQKRVRFFLVAGTLLGCIRNKAPLAHDRDVDIAVMEDVSNRDIIEVLRANNEFSCPQHYSEDDTYFTIAHNNIAIDVFRHIAENNHIWCGLSRHHGDMKWRYTPFGLREHLIFDLPFAVPDATQRYLSENYGDWKTKDTGFSSVLSSPARYGVDKQVIRYFAYARLWLMAQKKDPDLINKHIEQSPIEVKSDTDLLIRLLDII